MILYNLLIISIYMALLLYILFVTRDVFSVKAYFLYVAGTWIMGALLCENGFFAWPPNYTRQPHNFSALILLSFVMSTYFSSSLISSLFLRIKVRNIKVSYQINYQYTGMFLLGIAVMLVLLFFNAYIIIVGAPFFSSNANYARAVFWRTLGAPQLKRILTLFLPAVIVFLSLHLKKRRGVQIVFFSSVALYIISNILLSQKSNILFLMVPLLLSFYYRFAKTLNVNMLIKRAALIGALVIFFMAAIEYINMPNGGISVFGQYRERSFSSGILVFVSRLSLGQGEPFWEVVQKWIRNGDVNPTLGLEGYRYYAQLITASKIFGQEILYQNSFEYWVTKKLTSEWFAATYNMVITYLGEGIIYFGIIGLFLNAIIASILLGVTDYLIKYYLFVQAYDKFIVVIILFSANIITWLQMGNTFNFIKITELLYLLFLYGIITAIVNYLPQRRIVARGYQHV